MTSNESVPAVTPGGLRRAVNALVNGDYEAFHSENRSLTGAQSYAVLAATAASFVARMWPNSDPSLEQLAEYSGRLIAQVPAGQVPAGYVEAAMREALGEDGVTEGIPTKDLIPVQFLIIRAGSVAVVTDVVGRAEIVDEVVGALIELFH